jgi:N,N'-diacetyllegionaminate synthase
LAEVQATVAFLQRCNHSYHRPDKLALLQCTSMYPNADSDVNLRAMDTLRAATNLPVGYSDHSCDDLALFIAAARGASVLEFHFTDAREGKTFRDHAISINHAELCALVVKLKRLEMLLGSSEKRALPVEHESGHVVSFRRAIYAKRDLRAGEPLRAEDLVALRPNHGVDARAFDSIIGKSVAADTPAFAALRLLD